MSTFVIYNTDSNEDLSGHDRLVDAYQEVDQLNRARGGGRFAVRLALAHRGVWQRWEQPGLGRPS